MLFFWLLNYLQENYNPEVITVEVWDKQWMQMRVEQNKNFLNTGILDKLEYIENAENSVFIRRIKHILALLWFNKYKKYFKVFGWGEVLDETRKFPHSGRNLILLHNYSIRKWQFILVWWVGTDYKKSTKKLYKYLLPKAQKIICREVVSVSRAKKYIKNDSKVLLHSDFSKDLLLDKNGTKQNKTILINISPKHFNKQNLNKIKQYTLKYKGYKKIFLPADINFDKQFYSSLRKIVPDLEIYDRTKHTLSETVDLFKSCHGGIWSRLHFLYPLKVFKKELVSISSSDKVKKMIPHTTPSHLRRGRVRY